VPDVRANGVSLYYEQHAAGEPIVCIIGTSGSAAVWADTAAELATRGRTITYDRRWCFRSERPEPYVTNVHEHGNDAAALIDALTAAPAIVIGRSYGGETAIDLALGYRECVRALVPLEASLLSMSETAARWAEGVKQQVFAPADVDMSAVAETLLRNVLGNAIESLLRAPPEIHRGRGTFFRTRHSRSYSSWRRIQSCHASPLSRPVGSRSRIG
jgi:esterase